jgi:hypothetical protein
MNARMVDRDTKFCPSLRSALARLFEKVKSFNGRCSYAELYQGRGSPQIAVDRIVAAQSLKIPNRSTSLNKPAASI